MEAVYAVASDRPDRYESVLSSIRRWAEEVETAFERSAAEEGGMRRVRFVTDPNCELAVDHVVLPSTADDSFSAMIAALRDLGLARPDRKYLVWMDATLLCGIATEDLDDRPGYPNASDGSYAQYARIDTGCWGYLDRYPQSYSIEAHELMHTLGAVHLSAPHATGAGHCWDGYDVMCYDDGSGYRLQQVCPLSHQPLFDCNHDDYFDTDPAPGDYLYTHWNTADSSFLEGGGRPPPKLAVGLDGTGSGTVSSDVGGVNCGDVCWADLPDGTTVTLTATPASGSSFTGWGEDCSGSGPCRLVVNGPRFVVATFDRVGGTFRPDALIGRGVSDLVGDNVYNRTGVRQRKTLRVQRNQTATFVVLIQNDSRVLDTIHVWGTWGSDAVDVRYLLKSASGGFTDLTPSVMNGGVFFHMGPYWEVQMKIRARAYRWARRGSVTPIRLVVWSSGNEGRVDAVRGLVKIAR